jgi:hypothetical protein
MFTVPSTQTPPAIIAAGVRNSNVPPTVLPTAWSADMTAIPPPMPSVTPIPMPNDILPRYGVPLPPSSVPAITPKRIGGKPVNPI